MWKAFSELLELGGIENKMPRMVAVQAEGCAPIYKAWNEGKEFAPLWNDAKTIAAGIRVPVAVGTVVPTPTIAENEVAVRISLTTQLPL